MVINIDARAIIVFQLLVSYFVLKMRHVSAMITGFIIASIGIGITFYTGNGFYTILGIMIFAIGEMMTNPTFSSFIALISPKGKEALYMGTYFLPIFLGNFLTTFISGNLYEDWSDKISLLKTEMASRNIEMPEITKEFTKNDYFASASEKLGMTQTEMTQMVWDTYNPNKIWYVIVAIGIVLIGYSAIVLVFEMSLSSGSLIYFLTLVLVISYIYLRKRKYHYSFYIVLIIIGSVYITLFISHTKSSRKQIYAMYVAILSLVLTFIATTYLLVSFDSEVRDFQFVERYHWIDSIGLQ